MEWSGAVAPGANIDLVASADTNNSAGIDLSAMYIVNFNGDKGLAPILSESYGICELGAGTSGNIFYNGLWSQAASEGITVVIAAGDNGSASCDTEETNGFPSQPALSGLQVNAIASTPYDIAVGATDFNDFTNPFTYFGNGNGNNATTQLSAKSYIPETTWNDTCTNSTVYSEIFDLSSAVAACNSATVQGDGFVIPVGGSGGMSNCTSSDGENPSSCTGGYAKPSWQTGPGVPNDGKRDLPDVSLFGADGLLSGSFYVDCEADFPISSTNNTPIGACDLATENFLGFGGTSVSAQAFAGIMALIDQSTNSKQGNANPTFYALAAEQSSTTCISNSSLTSSTSSTCPFNDVADGSTNSMPCQAEATHAEPVVSPDCPSTSSESIGVLTVPSSVTAIAPTLTGFGFTTGTGYDLATGLGTPNVSVLIGKWGPNFYISASSPTVTVPQGSAQSLTLTVTGVNLTGPLVVSGFSCPVLPSLATCTFTTNPATSPASVTLTPTQGNPNPSATVTVMVSTAASSAAPAWKLVGPNKWTPGQILAVSCVFVHGRDVRCISWASAALGHGLRADRLCGPHCDGRMRRGRQQFRRRGGWRRWRTGGTPRAQQLQPLRPPTER